MARRPHETVDITMPWKGKERTFGDVCVECYHRIIRSDDDDDGIFPQPFDRYYNASEGERKVLVHLLYKKAIQEWRRRGEEVDLG